MMEIYREGGKDGSIQTEKRSGCLVGSTPAVSGSAREGSGTILETNERLMRDRFLPSDYKHVL